MIKITVLIGGVFLVTGCAGIINKQNPAPIYGESQVSKFPNDETNVSSNDPATVDTTVGRVEPSVILKQQDVIIKPQSQTKPSGVILALLTDAELSYQQGQLNDSVATIERALRIEPRNPLLLYKLARIRLEQGQPALAENLAKKSELFAEGNTQLKKKNWLLIARACEQQNNRQGASIAYQKALNFR